MRKIWRNRRFVTLLLFITSALIAFLLFSFKTRPNQIMSQLQMEHKNDTKQLDIHTKEYEIMRRNLHANLWQMHYFLNTQKLNGTFPEFDIFTEYLLDQTISMLAESENLRSINNGDEWHRSELQKLTNFIQERLHQFQHPKSCSEARILICEYDNCGFACLVHRIAYCLRFAVASNRTMVIDRDSIGQYSSKGWASAFRPVSSCSYAEIIKEQNPTANWSFIEQTDRVVTLIVDELWPIKKPIERQLSFPKQLADNLLTHHSNPPLFFGAQFHWYITRSNRKMENMINNIVDKINLNAGPIVGLQIRRTDKYQEADFFDLEDYFKWAEKWFKIQERKNVGKSLKRRVYIATDEPELIEEAKEKFPNYEIYADIKISKIAQLSNRYTEESLRGIFADIKILSKCDFVVCTFSSNVGRLVYELQQIEKGDAAHSVHSLDLPYGDHRQSDSEFVVILDHIPQHENEIELKTGDILKLDNYHGHMFTGYARALNNRTLQRGLFPSYKVQDKWRIVDIPLFEP